MYQLFLLHTNSSNMISHSFANTSDHTVTGDETYQNTTRPEFFWRPKNTNRSCYSTGIDCRRSGCKFPKCSVIYFVGIRNSLHAMVSCKNHPIHWPFNYLLCLGDIELKILICSIFCGIFKYFEKLLKYLTLISAIICY